MEEPTSDSPPARETAGPPATQRHLRGLLTGFGAFLDVQQNPSGQLALALAAAPPGGVELRGIELPVSFLRAPERIDEALAQDPDYDFFLSMGVHRGPSFRPERVGRAFLHSRQPDNDGLLGGQVALDGGPPLETPFALAPLARALAHGRLEVELSSDAGGYVCERVCRHIYRRAAERGRPALFLHVPPLASASLEEQLPVVSALIEELARQCRESPLGGPRASLER